MKKIITFAIATALALSLAACAPKEGNNISSGSIQGGASGNVNIADTTQYYGKISGVAGNEIDVDLAKEPKIDAPESMPELKDGEIMASMTVTPATTAGEGGTGGAAQRIEPDYTGETKSFVVPAGIEVKDTMGAVKSLSDIKKGDMIVVFVDKDENIVEVLYLG